LDILEASPVFVGANALTGTLGVKAIEDQADGAGTIDAGTLAEAVALVQTKRDAEAADVKRLAEEAAALERKAAEASQLAAEQAERARIAAIAAKEFDRFQRTMRRTA
jgi:hypothetical protein